MTFIGAGNMATNLAMAFYKKGVAIRCVYSHTLANAQVLADMVGCACAVNDLARVPQDDVYIYAVKDAFLKEVLTQIDAPEALHLHTAGSVGIDAFDHATKPHSGVLYPFQTLSKSRVLDFSIQPIFIETTLADDLSRVKDLAGIISSEVYEANSDTRTRLHLAGVFANNFTNCMYAIAGELLKETGLPEKVLLSLQDETAAKVHEVSPRDAQTGPAVRGDRNVMQRHIDALPTDELKELYRLISMNIQNRSL